jgi:hypothetical protein
MNYEGSSKMLNVQSVRQNNRSQIGRISIGGECLLPGNQCLAMTGLETKNYLPVDVLNLEKLGLVEGC